MKQRCTAWAQAGIRLFGRLLGLYASCLLIPEFIPVADARRHALRSEPSHSVLLCHSCRATHPKTLSKRRSSSVRSQEKSSRYSGTQDPRLRANPAAESVPSLHLRTDTSDADLTQHRSSSEQARSADAEATLAEQPYASHSTLPHQVSHAAPQHQQSHDHQHIDQAAPPQQTPPNTSNMHSLPQTDAQFEQAMDAVLDDDTPKGEIGYDDYLYSDHGAMDNDIQIQLKPEDKLGSVSMRYSADRDSSPAADMPDMPEHDGTVWGQIQHRVYAALGTVRQKVSRVVTPVELKAKGATTSTYVQYGLDLLARAAVILVGAALVGFALLGAWRGCCQLAAALKQPAFYLTWVGIAVIGIVTFQTPRNNQLLQMLNESSFFANYGQAKRFLDVVTYTSVGLLFAGVFVLGLG